MAEIMAGSMTRESSKGNGTKAMVTLQLATAPICTEGLENTPSDQLRLATDSETTRTEPP
jgi:hypothetical protein